MPALRAKMTLWEEVWGEYFTFCFERNPWDRVVSLFFWIKKNTSHTNYTFDQFLEEQEGKIRRYSTFYRDAQRKVMVDKIYRFEDIPFALEDISKKLSLSTPLDLPKEKCKWNTERNGTHYSEILTPKQADTISGWCKESIDLFGYSYENISQRKEMSRKNSKAYSRQIPRAELC